MRKNRILFVLHLPPPVHGSAMVGQFIKESLDINQAFESRYINLGTSNQINEIGKKKITKLVRSMKILVQIVIQIINFKPQYCYFALTAKGMAFYKDALILMFVKVLGVKLIYHFHNKGVSTRQNYKLDNFIYRNVFRRSEVILLSEYLYPDIQKYVPKERVYYCPNGIPGVQTNTSLSHVDSEENSHTSIKLKNRKKRAVEILFLSNLIESKGVLVLLDACKILHNKQLFFRCTFVGGDGDITKEQLLHKVSSMGLNNSVVIAGKKFGAEKERILQQSEIFAFPTYYHNECFPLVLLEAMQHSLPIISTTEGGIRGIVDEGETGFVVEKKDANAIAEKLEELILNPALRKNMGAAGHVKYEREFTLNKFESKFKEILENIVM